MENLLWWHWIVLGIILVLMELVVPSFTIFWFGLGALVTGLLLAILPEISLKWQLLVFSLSSIGFTFFWFRFFVPRKKIKALLVDEQAAIGQTGIAATRALIPGEIGRVVFSIPVLDDEAWMYLADEPIETGNRVRVTAILSSKQKGRDQDRILKVEKVR
ncbi:MAG: NfeD family protein [Desulfocapsaceae bacterium]|jgi:membrane protein implicated in regulation of membrane protease activity|nr:NfeD family protein [Desulfocapsaceae bacterium]